MIKLIQLLSILLLSISPLLLADTLSKPTVLTNDTLLNLDFNQVPTRALLLNLARFSQKNILISPTIQGEMSLHIDHLAWPDVLQFIVRSQHLSMQQWGSVTYITTQAEDNLEQTAPLTPVLVPLSYAKASDLLALIKASDNHLLSAKGSISADARTNSLWLEDRPEKLTALERFIKQMDIATPQIAIEAKIVTVDIFHERDLGFQFGINSLHHLSGTLAGANLAQQSTSSAVPVNQRLNFSLPATPLDAAPASVGVAMLKLADGYAVDLELSALEAEGFAKIIASPKLLTGNLQTASIETGEDIPYQEKTSSGATNVAFKKAVLSLAVTPQIIHHQHILLTLKISQDKASEREVNGVPAINTREITTQVLVDDQQTVVLGGIYELDVQQRIKRIPFLSDLPWIGPLFTYHHDADQKRELLIFVKPNLVNG